MSSDETTRTRRLILSRRAKFVAAALATVACGKSGGSGDGCGPRPCLEPPIVALPDAGPAPSAPEAGMMAVSDAGAPDATPQTPQNPDAGDAGPRQARGKQLDGGEATTKIKPKHPPAACLNVLLNDDDR